MLDVPKEKIPPANGVFDFSFAEKRMRARRGGVEAAP